MRCLPPNSLCIFTLHVVTWMSTSFTFPVFIGWQAMSSSPSCANLLPNCWWHTFYSSQNLVCSVCYGSVAGTVVSVVYAVRVGCIAQVDRVVFVAMSHRAVLVPDRHCVMFFNASCEFGRRRRRSRRNHSDLYPHRHRLLCVSSKYFIL